LLSVTLTVLLGSIIFNVRTVNTYAFNMDVYREGRELSDRVLSHADIRGRSIFLLNDARIIERIEDNVPEVRVINIERKFPDRVTVNFVRLFNYFQVYDSGTYYLLLASGRITASSYYPPAGQHIEVRSDFSLSASVNVGDYLFDSADAAFLREATVAMGRLGLTESAAASFFEYIDLSVSQNIIYLGVRRGGHIRILGRGNFLNKLRLGISVFNDPERGIGRGDTVTVSDTGYGVRADVHAPGR